MKRTLFAVLVAAGVLSACNGEVPIVGFDENGQTIETMVPQGMYVNRLSQTLGEVQESAMPSLDSERAQKIIGLRQIRIGVGLTGSVGLGDWFKLGGNVGLRLGLTNKK